MGKGGFVLLLFLLLFWRRILFPTTRGVGRAAPLHSLGGRVREGCAPSRALRGGGRTEIFGWARGVLFFCFFYCCSGEGFCFRRRGGGARCSPTSPRVTGCERAARPLALSAVRDERRFLDGQGRFCSLAIFYCCSGEGFCFRRRGGGARCSPTSPRVTEFERAARPLVLSAVGDERRFFCMGKGCFVLLLFLLLFWRRTSFPTARAWGAPLPYIPSGDGVREGCAPSRVLRGGGRTEIFWMGKGES